jgi:hypothetical protein
MHLLLLLLLLLLRLRLRASCLAACCLHACQQLVCLIRWVHKRKLVLQL